MEIIGIEKKKVEKISDYKQEDEWVKEYRLSSFDIFKKLPMPSFGPTFDLDFDKITYYKNNKINMNTNWNDVGDNIKSEFEELGVIRGEKNLDGLGVQYESEVIYHNMLEEVKNKKVVFTSIEEGMKKYPELVKKYFGKIVSNDDNKFAALNSSVFSGGSFIYIPPNTILDRPLHSYFRINSKAMGQFERTLIIVDDNSSLHYVEGCTAPTYNEASLHASVVEIYVGKNSKCRYSTVQNWATNVFNLVTKRALVEENGSMEWIDGNIGSKLTMKYPACILKGDNSSGTCITISSASNAQEQDTGARMIHIGNNTKSQIISKSIAKLGGNATYRGEVKIKDSANNSEAFVKCDTLILDDKSKSDTFPKNIVENKTSALIHEATVSKISQDNIFYLMSRGISREEAIELIMLGFIEKFRQELPLEYAVELNQLLRKNL